MINSNNNTLTNILSYSKVCLLGICGSGMSALAKWFINNDVNVIGFDTSNSQILNDTNIKIIHNEDITLLPKEFNTPSETLVVYSSAISQNNKLLNALINKGFKVVKRSVCFEYITSNFYTLSVAGTHGKTTTSSLLTHLLYSTHYHINAFLGGVMKNYKSNFVKNANKNNDLQLAIVEADEYDNFFLSLHSNIVIITNIDIDHLDIFSNVENYQNAFYNFVNKTKSNGTIIIHKSALQKISKNIESKYNVLCYDLQDAPIHAENIKYDNNKITFDYESPRKKIKDIYLPLNGQHNIENTLAVISAVLQLNINEDLIRNSISTFLGVEKRFDIVLDNENNVIIDDYAHHPTEIKAVINTAKSLYSNRKITIVFRPNQYSRTYYFLDEFAKVLDMVDKVIIISIFSDRELNVNNISSQSIIEKMTIKDKIVCSPETVINSLIKLGPHDVILNLGAGDSTKFIKDIKQAINNSK